MRTTITVLAVLISAVVSVGRQQVSPARLEVFQNLDEATSRIPNLDKKPYLALIEANDGLFQNEVIIFKDIETGKEVWSLTREQCIEMAHTGRRPAWSANGQYISFKGNAAFYSLRYKQIRRRKWAGFTYIANADGSRKRPLYAMSDGKPTKFNCSKYNMWDAKVPNAWYCVVGDKLIRVMIADGLTNSRAEAIYTFPNDHYKVIQEISDGDFMLIEESGKQPNCYVVNLNKDPSAPSFCLTYPLKGAIHSGSFRFMRSRKIVRGHYQAGGPAATVRLSFEDEKRLVPLSDRDYKPIHITKGRRMDHLWYGPPDDRVGFFGKYNGRSGLYLQMPGKTPVLMADVPDGHVTWCGRDPEWFFAAVGPGRCRDKQYARRLLACNADGKTIKIVCTPYDRRRPGKKTYMSIPLPTQSRDGTKCWFHSSMLMPTNVQTGSYIAVFRRPYPPTALKLTSGRTGGVLVQWTPNKISYEVKGYHVYRKGADGGFVEVTDRAVKGLRFTDKTARLGGQYTYAVTAEEWSRLESDTTSPTITVSLSNRGCKLLSAGGGVSGWDRTAPAKVRRFGADLYHGMIRLRWQPSREKDYRYYNIYASSAGPPAVSQRRLLVSPTHDETSYIDWSAPVGGNGGNGGNNGNKGGTTAGVRKMYYAITVIDRQGNESAPALTSIMAP